MKKNKISFRYLSQLLGKNFLRDADWYKGRSSGMTVIEITFVISIAAMLWSIIMAGVAQSRLQAHDNRRIADFRQIVNALELFYDKYGVYPCGKFGRITFQGSWDSTIAGPLFLNGRFLDAPGIGCINPPYAVGLNTEDIIDQPIADPVNNSPTVYMYELSDDRQNYILYTRLMSASYAGKMQNDGGTCANYYEYSIARGNMQPDIIAPAILSVPCN